MNILFNRGVRVLLHTLNIIHTRRRQTVLSLHQVTPVLTIRSNLRTLLSRDRLRVHIKNFFSRGHNHVVKVQMNMFVPLLNNLRRLPCRDQVKKCNLITNSGTSNINIT